MRYCLTFAVRIMAVILPVFSFALIFCCCGIFFPAQTSKRVVLLISVLLFSALIVLSTEVLSAFKAISYPVVLAWWAVFCITATLFILRHQNAFAGFCAGLYKRLKDFWQSATVIEKILAAIVSIFFVLIFIQGIVYPPNNWDSMTYHLARIVSWLSHHSVAHYPTALTRQIYQPPFAEYLIMQINLLSGGDYFSASVQFFFYLASLVVISLVVKEMSLNRHYQMLTVVIGATIPEVILQASSTQNDVVVSFFVLTACLFAWKALSQPPAANRRLLTVNFVSLGISIGLGLFTKGTGYIYYAPPLLIFGISIIVKSIKTRNYQYLKKAIFAGLLCIAINGAFYLRNHRMAGNLLGVDKSEMKIYANQKMSAGLLFSNVLKNAVLHSNVLYATYLDEKVDTAIYRWHRAMDININDPAVNYRDTRFSAVSDLTGEDSAPNLIHLLLFFSAVIVFLFARRQRSAAAWLILLVLVGQYALLCGYLKWQPWNTRLHTPLFLLMAPFVVYAISLSRFYQKVFYVIVPVLLFEGFVICLHNTAKPLNKLSADRYANYFINKPRAYSEYQAVSRKLEAGSYKNIGLLVGEDDWIYPLFTDCYRRPVSPVYLNVHNNTANAAADTAKADCIISTDVNPGFIDYRGKRFYKQDANNKVIALYK